MVAQPPASSFSLGLCPNRVANVPEQALVPSDTLGLCTQSVAVVPEPPTLQVVLQSHYEQKSSLVSELNALRATHTDASTIATIDAELVKVQGVTRQQAEEAYQVERAKTQSVIDERNQILAYAKEEFGVERAKTQASHETTRVLYQKASDEINQERNKTQEALVEIERLKGCIADSERGREASNIGYQRERELSAARQAKLEAAMLASKSAHETVLATQRAHSADRKFDETQYARANTANAQLSARNKTLEDSTSRLEEALKKAQVEADLAQNVLAAAQVSVRDATASKDEIIRISKREMELSMAEVDKFQKEADELRKDSRTCLEASDNARATMYEQLAKAREDLAELSRKNAVLRTDAAAAIQKETVVRTEVALLQAERSAAVAKATVEAASAIHAQQEQAKADDEEVLETDGPEFAEFIHRGRASRLKSAEDEEDEEDDDDWEDDPGQRFGYSDQTEYDEDVNAAQECPPRVVNFNMSTPPLHRYPQHSSEEAADPHVGHGFFPRYAERGRPMSPRALFGTSLFNHSVPSAPHHFAGKEPCTAQAQPDPLHPLYQAYAGAPAKPPTFTALHKSCYETTSSGFTPGVFRTLPKVSLVTPPPPRLVIRLYKAIDVTCPPHMTPLFLVAMAPRLHTMMALSLRSLDRYQR